MDTPSPASTTTAKSSTSGIKRPRETSEDPSPHGPPLPAAQPPSPPISTLPASSFRNVSACNRCRSRKNRCDQRLPACASCEKARVKCVGYDPITKREIPRSYVYYLETRVSYLETVLRNNNISYVPSEAFDLNYKLGPDNVGGSAPSDEQQPALDKTLNTSAPNDLGLGPIGGFKDESQETKRNDAEKLNKLVSNIGMVSVQGASDSRYLGSTSGISFARVVFAAVKSSMPGSSSERGSTRASHPITRGAGVPSMRESFFGLHTKPTIKQAPFPEKDLGRKLVGLYFEHANPQLPILHRGEFMVLFDRTYASDPEGRTPRDLYILNMVFAVGAGIIWGDCDADDSSMASGSDSPSKHSSSSASKKRQKMSGQQHQPEEYHASAIIHLESILGSLTAPDRLDGFGGGLDALQAVLLLASFALLRPVAPGLWYIIGVAVRLAVDLGLHYEDGTAIEGGPGEDISIEAMTKGAGGNTGAASGHRVIDEKEIGRRQWVRDQRRRLWWCVYSFDRLVSVCVGRPFGITDQVITTEFPSLLDDAYITTTGFWNPPGGLQAPSYKRVAHHYFRLRLLQSEMLQVLQHQQAQQARANGANRGNQFMHTKLSSPFLQKFNDSFRDWRIDIDRRLWEWKEAAPRTEETGVKFSVQFLELNYWQAVIMLYRQSLSVPPMLAGELGTTDDISSPSMIKIEAREDEDRVFLKVAEAGQKILRLYRQLHRVRLVNYTFLATHHLFMAGISFLYAIWHSSVVRSRLSLDEVDFTVLAATSVLGDLISKCPPAEACRDAFDRMSKATVQMCLSTTGFGSRPSGLDSRQESQGPPSGSQRPGQSQEDSDQRAQQDYFNESQGSRRAPPRFDMNLGDLFSDANGELGSFGRTNNGPRLRRPSATWKPSEEEHTSSANDSRVPANLQPGFDMERPADLDIDPNLQPPPQIAPHHEAYAQSTSYPEYGFSNMDFTGGAGAVGNNPEIDLGFGMGLDVEHDWSDGSHLDLFDGFFWGGPGAGL
ncbi:MAG: hypothetical protein M1819_003517 [Sarea resinae]|nr:MAG: hypothetical protein M1819_003517 [Sarea resinae]